MNRDKKLGLALGVLLVGIVGAFFFRNEPVGGPELPKLENPKKLDDRIAEKPLVPYLSGIETDESTRNVSHPRSRPSTSRSDQDWPVRPDDAWDRAPSTSATRDERGTLPPPQPIPMVADGPVPGKTPRNPDHNREWSTVAEPESVARPAAIQLEQVVHEVRGGETLSGLSLKYLGTPNRYEEILEANRDQLKVPKDLRIGMKIRIPPRTSAERTASKKEKSTGEPARSREASGAPKSEPRRAAEEKPPRRAAAPTRTISTNSFDESEEPFAPEPTRSSGVAQSNAEEPAFSDPRPAQDPGDDRLFRAARRNPFLPGPSDSGESAASPSTGKSLSQKLPADLPSFDDESPFGAAPRTSAPARPLHEKALPERALPERSNVSPSAGTKSSSAKPIDGLAPGRYIVQRGDTLERIAQRLFGDRAAAQRILNANSDLLHEAEDLREGMSLRIPQ